MNQVRTELVAELLGVIGPGISINDVKTYCRIAPIVAGRTQFDREYVLERLISEGVLLIREARVLVNQTILVKFLEEKLAGGDQVAWNLVEATDDSLAIEAKFPRDLLERIGQAGETAVVEELKRQLAPELHEQIDQVSLRDDTAGFDIWAPLVTKSTGFARLEVKTCSRPGKDFLFFLSRNEARVAVGTQNWFLVGVVRLDEVLTVLGHLPLHNFSALLPNDTSSRSRWESASVRLPKSRFRPGLP